jgi:hypothetical protein
MIRIELRKVLRKNEKYGGWVDYSVVALLKINEKKMYQCESHNIEILLKGSNSRGRIKAFVSKWKRYAESLRLGFEVAYSAQQVVDSQNPYQVAEAIFDLLTDVQGALEKESYRGS